jgi:hypothetical protein
MRGGVTPSLKGLPSPALARERGQGVRAKTILPSLVSDCFASPIQSGMARNDRRGILAFTGSPSFLGNDGKGSLRAAGAVVEGGGERLSDLQVHVVAIDVEGRHEALPNVHGSPRGGLAFGARSTRVVLEVVAGTLGRKPKYLGVGMITAVELIAHDPHSLRELTAF